MDPIIKPAPIERNSNRDEEEKDGDKNVSPVETAVVTEEMLNKEDDDDDDVDSQAEGGNEEPVSGSEEAGKDRDELELSRKQMEEMNLGSKSNEVQVTVESNDNVRIAQNRNDQRRIFPPIPRRPIRIQGPSQVMLFVPASMAQIQSLRPGFQNNLRSPGLATANQPISPRFDDSTEDQNELQNEPPNAGRDLELRTGNEASDSEDFQPIQYEVIQGLPVYNPETGVDRDQEEEA